MRTVVRKHKVVLDHVGNREDQAIEPVETADDVVPQIGGT